MIRWCWRCQMNIPMLTDKEFKLCLEAQKQGKEFVQDEIKKRKILDYEWLNEIPNSYKKQRYFIDMYRVITGFKEQNPNAIWHHVINQFGPDCPECQKPLRTKKARYCAECGFGMDDFKKGNTKTLIERKPELFKK